MRARAPLLLFFITSPAAFIIHQYENNQSNITPTLIINVNYSVYGDSAGTAARCLEPVPGADAGGQHRRALPVPSSPGGRPHLAGTLRGS